MSEAEQRGFAPPSSDPGSGATPPPQESGDESVSSITVERLTVEDSPSGTAADAGRQVVVFDDQTPPQEDK